MIYGVGDLIIFNDLFQHQSYTGVIIDLIRDDVWYGGGCYVIHWEYPENYSDIQDNKASFELMKTWVKNGEAQVYPLNR